MSLRRLLGIALLVGLAPALVGAKSLTSSAGKVLPAPQIENLSCDQLLDLMHQYSASGYRGIGVIPTSGPDALLLSYEDDLATAHYDRCHLGKSDFSSPATTFGKGFN